MDQLDTDSHRATELTLQASIHLGLSADTVCTACNYLHRYFAYLKKCAAEAESRGESDTAYDLGVVVSTALYLACEVNERRISYSELISSVFYHINTTPPYDYEEYQPLNTRAPQYWNLRNSVVQFQLLMLRILGFDLVIDLPQKHLIFYLKSLHDWINKERLMEQLFGMAWSLLNDYFCYHQDSGKWPAHLLALACIELAIEVVEPEVRGVIENKKPWYCHFDPRIDKSQLESIVKQVASVYRMEKKASLLTHGLPEMPGREDKPCTAP